jgi:predicted transcriptional regulator
MQLSHSLAEPRPPGIALRRRSKTANGPRSFATRWLNLKVASDPRMKRNQRILSLFKKNFSGGKDQQIIDEREQVEEAKAHVCPKPE